MSEWQVRVIKIDNIQKHPNADLLSIVNVDGGYPCIINTSDFKIGDLAVYIPIDSICPDVFPFDFLNGKPIKAKKLRGIFSMGLLIHASKGMEVGQIVDKELHIKKYEPELEAAGKSKILTGDDEKDPGIVPVYTDIESMRKHNKIITTDDEVVLTEKIHGCNFRAVFSNGKLYIGSHNKFKRLPWYYDELSLLNKTKMHIANILLYLQNKFNLRYKQKLNKFVRRNRYMPIKSSVWTDIALKYNLRELLAKYPDIAIYGEVYGPVQYLHYGKEKEADLVLFDALDVKTKKYLDYDDFVEHAKKLNIPTTPLLYRGKWKDELAELRNGKSTMPNTNHLREGFVLRTAKEKTSPKIGRLCLKFVGEDYLLDKKNK